MNFLIALSAILPSYYYISDVILVFIFLLFSRDLQSYLLLLVFFVPILIGLLFYDTFFLRFILPMLRPILVFGVFLAFLKNKSFELNSYLLVMAFFVFLNLVVNLLAYFDVFDFYIINSLWNGPNRIYNDSGMTIAGIASLQGRFSGVFAQPAAAGLFSILSILVFLSERKSKYYIFVFFAILNGVFSNSSVFDMGVIVVLFVYFCYLLRLNLRFFVYFAILVPSLITVAGLSGFLPSFIDSYVFGLRFDPSGNFYRIFSSFTGVDYLFGGGYKYGNEVVGDNAILMRTFALGIFFNAIYIFIISYLILSVPYINISKNYINVSLILVLFLAETGFTSFSQPGIVLFAFLPFFKDFYLRQMELK